MSKDEFYELGSDAEDRANEEIGFGWDPDTIGLNVEADDEDHSSVCQSDEAIARQLHFHLFGINKDEESYFIVDPNHPDPNDKGMKGDGSADFDGWLPLVEIVRFVRSKLTP